MDKRYTRKAISERIRQRMNPPPTQANPAGVINTLIQRAKQIKQLKGQRVK